MKSYIVATIKPWNIEAFNRYKSDLPGDWHLLTEKDELTFALIEKLKPRYIFFPHWSWIVPQDILSKVECVCFHMADVPYGRGGSPLQNLIMRGHKETKLSALRMTEDLDAGPVYSKKPLSLEGKAQDVFDRVSNQVYEIIDEIVRNEPIPVPQEGVPTVFQRRTPAMSVLPDEGTLELLYDHIRMLDANTYPKAFLDYGDFQLTFEDAALQDGGILTAKVVIKRRQS